MRKSIQSWLAALRIWLRPVYNLAGVTVVGICLRWQWQRANRAKRGVRSLVFDAAAWQRHHPNLGRPGAPQYIEVFPETEVPVRAARTIVLLRPDPWTLSRYRSNWRPPAFVVGVPGGRLDGRTHDVTTDSGDLLSACSFYGPENAYRDARGVLERAGRAAPPRYLPGVAASVASLYGHENYFHWLFNVVPRFDLLNRAGLKSERVDWYVLPAPRWPFHAETLAGLGIPNDKIVVCDEDTFLSADVLWATSAVRAVGQSSDWACDFLRRLFLDEPQSGRLRLYISRRDSAQHPLTNEGEIEAWLVTRGFQIVVASHLSVREQAQIFAQAEVVVSPHGAGLANLVFCPSGTKVVELFPPAWRRMYYWELSNCRQLEYFYLFGISVSGLSDERAFHVPLPWLEKLLACADI